MQFRISHIAFMVVAFFAGLAAVFTVIFVLTDQPGRQVAGIATQTSSIGGGFRLTDHNAQTVTEQSLKGRPSLIFFGFTHCPDVCPTALFEISEIMTKLGAAAERVNAVFVTVDPERDTPEKLKDYLASFHPRVIGLTGSQDDLAAMFKNYRVFAKKVPLDKGGYSMDHTALVYLMDKNGNFVSPFSLKRTPDEAAADLRRHI